jgi:hypothetical protein
VLFFGVDELIKHPSYADVLTKVGSTMDTVWTLFSSNPESQQPRQLIVLPVVTSLSSLVVHESVTPISNRGVAWIPLGPLRGAAEHIAKLFPQLDGSVLVQKALRILCTDLGEHGRMLEKLVDYLKGDGGKHAEFLNSHHTSAVSGILDALEGPCNGYLSISLKYNHGLSIVSAALLGQPVVRDAFPEGYDDETFEDLLTAGTYISSESSAADTQTFIPVMSPFQLLHWARGAINCSDLVGQVAAVLLRVMSRFAIIDGYVFEEFVCGTCLRAQCSIILTHHIQYLFLVKLFFLSIAINLGERRFFSFL